MFRILTFSSFETNFYDVEFRVPEDKQFCTKKKLAYITSKLLHEMCEARCKNRYDKNMFSIYICFVST